METVCALSVIDDKRGASGRKMPDFMMDGVCFKGLCTFFGTVRQVSVRFSDGWSRKGKVQEYNINLADKLEFSCIDYDLSLGSFSLILVRYTKVLIDSELSG